MEKALIETDQVRVQLFAQIGNDPFTQQGHEIEARGGGQCQQ